MEQIQIGNNNFPAEIKKVDINSVFPNAWNPNLESTIVFKALVNSVKKIGFIVPVLVREIQSGVYEIIDGEHKWKAAQELGYTEVLVAILGGVDDNLAKTLTIILNNTRGDDDVLKRAELLKQIKEGQASLFELMPFEEKRLEEELKLLDFDFSQFENTGDDTLELDEMTKALDMILTLDKFLHRLHADSKNTRFKLLLEQFFEWSRVMQGNLEK